MDMVDVETEEGFPDIDRYELLAIPSAILDGKFCSLSIEDNEVVIECPDD